MPGTKHKGHNWETVVLLFIETDTQVSLLSPDGGSTITGSCELLLLVKMRARAYNELLRGTMTSNRFQGKLPLHKRRTQTLQVPEGHLVY